MTEHEERSDELEADADTLERARDAVQDGIEGARADLHRKQGDMGVPGADHDDHFLAEDGEDEDDDEDDEAR